MLTFEDFDSWQDPNWPEIEPGEERYPSLKRPVNAYDGLLDDFLPCAPARLQMDVYHELPTGKFNQHGAEMTDYSELTPVCIEFTEPTRLRDALAALEDAQEVSAEEIGAEARHYFVETITLHQDEDGVILLYVGLGT